MVLRKVNNRAKCDESLRTYLEATTTIPHAPDKCARSFMKSY